MEAFKKEYLEQNSPYELLFVDINDNASSDDAHVSIDFKYNGQEYHSEADGNGPIDAVKLAIKQCIPSMVYTVENYSEHALGIGSHAKAAAYITMKDQRTGKVTFGVGLSSNITRASIRGMFSAMNRLVQFGKEYV